ncbi:unnamed protein product [Adineta ricciae]|uniref:Uncharacterized protein n=1 Tax=Adineta ricciae TaxID=249248 RepID=A0A815PZD9_ADIRI|nr:unnamed protein product [Adineta ricciae]
MCRLVPVEEILCNHRLNTIVNTDGLQQQHAHGPGKKRKPNHRLNTIVNTDGLQQQHAHGPGGDQINNTYQSPTLSLLIASMFGVLVASMLGTVPAAMIFILLIVFKLVL